MFLFFLLLFLFSFVILSFSPFVVPHAEAQDEKWEANHAIPFAQATADYAELARAVASRQAADPSAQQKTLEAIRSVLASAVQYIESRNKNPNPPNAEQFMAAVQNLLKDLKLWFESQKRKQNDLDFVSRVISDALKRRGTSMSNVSGAELEKLQAKGVSLASQVELTYKIDANGVIVSAAVGEMIDTATAILGKGNGEPLCFFHSLSLLLIFSWLFFLILFALRLLLLLLLIFSSVSSSDADAKRRQASDELTTALGSDAVAYIRAKVFGFDTESAERSLLDSTRAFASFCKQQQQQVDNSNTEIHEALK